LFAAQALGLIPGRDSAVLYGRRALSESVAVLCSLGVQQDNLPTAEAGIRAIAERNPDLLSAGLREAGGKLLVEVGHHAGPGAEQARPESTPTHVHLPLFVGDKPWGSVELRFQPLGPAGVWSYLHGSILPLAAFVFLGGFATTYGYLRAVLRHADPGRAKVVP